MPELVATYLSQRMQLTIVYTGPIVTVQGDRGRERLSIFTVAFTAGRNGDRITPGLPSQLCTGGSLLAGVPG